MTYYDITKYKFIKFKQSDKKKPGKKYMAILENKKTNRIVKVHFGDKKYQQYKDSTGLGLYSHLDHKDKKRRDAYRKRHKGFLRRGYYSPGMFSYRFLW
jgi:serine protease inhibitor ecotin